jgi:hypothetical protein
MRTVRRLVVRYNAASASATHAIGAATGARSCVTGGTGESTLKSRECFDYVRRLEDPVPQANLCWLQYACFGKPFDGFVGRSKRASD